ncbi:hypothetical protein [Streptomyces viridosporus]|uniref:hypothetical protein n=1 Tax=Streptomyces viridosporus TaxID=67581 RepID=UPI0009BF08E1|nr:hypothetical protein [Streptomyces viridosporus]
MRVTCDLLPFPPNGDRLPFGYMEHRWGMAQFLHAPGLPVLGVVFAWAGDRWFAVPCLAMGGYARVLSTLTTRGLWTLRRRRRARAAPARTARGGPDTVEE